MALVSINIPAMESLVSDLQSTEGRLSDLSTVRNQLKYVHLDTSSVDPVGSDREIWTWLRDRIRDLNRRLAMARLVAGSAPGVPGAGVVEIDESYISDLTQAQVQALANEAHSLMTSKPPPKPIDPNDPRLLEILRNNAHDPYFAQALAKTVPADKLASYLKGINNGRRMQGTPEDAQAFDSAYNELLNGLGLSYGIASQGTGPLEVPGMAKQWAESVGERQTHSGKAQVLSLVISRGSFSTSFLTTFHSRLRSLEDDHGVAHWATSGLDRIFDPDPTKSPATNIVGDPLAAVFQGMGNNPEALRQVFGTGPTVTIETDDGAVQVNAYLWDVLGTRGMDEYGVQQLMIGLQSGLGAAPVEGDAAWQPALASDLEAIGRAFQREARIAEENAPPWWSAAGHFLLDLIGLIPGVGEAADGLNGLWYLAEGNPIDSGLSFAGMVPMAGWFSVGGKWVRRTLNAEELATMQRLAEQGELARYLPNGNAADTIADLSDPSNFRFEDFVTPSEAARLRERQWLMRLRAGNKFNDYMNPNYPYNEVYLKLPGTNKYVRLDSYVPGEAIISRKLTQLSALSPSLARQYIDELVTKYPPGSTMANVPSNGSNAGSLIDGQMVLQVPPQQGGNIPSELAEYAFENNVRIIDINGVDYTAHLFDGP